MKPVDVLGLNLEATPAARWLLREQDSPQRVLSIFIGGREALAIALALSGSHRRGP